jgi:hypothetical protein
MKKVLVIISFIVISQILALAQVGIGTENPHSTVAVEIESKDKGFLISRMTFEQKNAIQNPAKALIIYQIDEFPGFYFYDVSTWVLMNPVIQKNADWNATSGERQILNKPNLSIVASTGNFTDLNDIPSIIYAFDTLKMSLPYLTFSKIRSLLDSKVDLTVLESEIERAKAIELESSSKIAQNTSEILSNTNGISANELNIRSLGAKVTENTADINSNATNISVYIKTLAA